jgi:hypothetical protein
MKSSTLAVFQGTYYTATGIWPLVHLRSFLAVTGPKNDLWLVRTVGSLVTCIGAQMLIAGRRGEVVPEVKMLAALSAASLAGIDVCYAANRTISPVYLLDAAVEVALGVLWCRSETSRL